MPERASRPRRRSAFCAVAEGTDLHEDLVARRSGLRCRRVFLRRRRRRTRSRTLRRRRQRNDTGRPVTGGFVEIDGRDFYEAGAVANHVELQRSGVRQVDDSVVHEGATIIHAYDDTPVIAQVADAHVARERQSLVRGRHQVHVVDLATGRQSAVKFTAVPGRDAALLVAAACRHDRVALAEYLVDRTVAVLARCFAPRQRVAGNVRAAGSRRPVAAQAAAAGGNQACGQDNGCESSQHRQTPLPRFPGPADTRRARTLRCDCIS